MKSFIDYDNAKHLGNKFEQFCINENVPGDGIIFNCSAVYGYIDFVQILVEKTSKIGMIIGEPVLPTYAYGRVYRKGSSLPKHIDRDACEISLTVHLGGDKHWPIYMCNPNQTPVGIDLEIGDAVMYFGPKIHHWREQYTGEAYVQMFLHYVRSGGKNSKLYFDSKYREQMAIKKLTFDK